MEQQHAYSEGFRRRMVARLSGPKAMTAMALAAEVQVPQTTLSRWLREAGKVEEMARRKAPTSQKVAPRRGADRPAAEKVRVVLEAAGIPEAELGAFLRREGLHAEELARMREEVQAAAIAGLGVKKTRAQTDEQRRIKELERDLKRKEAALAETAALLVLRKKAVALWGEEGEDT